LFYLLHKKIIPPNSSNSKNKKSATPFNIIRFQNGIQNGTYGAMGNLNISMKKQVLLRKMTSIKRKVTFSP
jgi:hypothetical protein